MEKLFFVLVTILSVTNLYSQGSNSGVIAGKTNGEDLNPITTAVPFMLIAPDPRSAGMGDAGVATSPDVYSQNWNSSKYAFSENPMGVSITYTPWLKKLVGDMSIAYLSGYYKLDDKQAIGASLRYFTLGSITFTDENGGKIMDASPNEWAIDGSYNRKLSDNYGMGIALRYIHSDLNNGVSTTGNTKAGQSVAMDINGFYSSDKIRLGDYNGKWTAGFNISNLGYKLGYSEETKNFIPTTLRLGGSLTMDIDKYNSVMVTADMNKLLVPTPPLYYKQGEIMPDGSEATGNRTEDEIKAGKNPDVGVITGVFQSFSDAPGGAKEEFNEIAYSVGLEYWYNKQFAARTGYFYEHETKGNRKYLTFGVGMKMNVFGLDFAYLVPTGQMATSPLSNTWRFSLVWDIQPQ